MGEEVVQKNAREKHEAVYEQIKQLLSPISVPFSFVYKEGKHVLTILKHTAQNVGLMSKEEGAEEIRIFVIEREDPMNVLKTLINLLESCRIPQLQPQPV